MTIVRAQEGTAARAFAEGSLVDLRITAGSLDAFSEVVSMYSPYYVCDASAADQADTVNANSLASLVDTIGTTLKATIILPHSGTGTTTAYNVLQNLDLSTYDNITYIIEHGAVITHSANTIDITVPQAGLYQIFSGTGTITFNPVNLRPVATSWFGDLNTAVSQIGAVNSVTLVVTDAQTLTANLTVTENIQLVVESGGSIVKASTYTCTIANLEAGLYQVFDGFSSGDVVLDGAIDALYPQWFGVVADGITNMSSEFTVAMNAAVGVAPLYVPPASSNYYFTSGLTVPPGIVVRGGFPNRNDNLDWGSVLEFSSAVSVGLTKSGTDDNFTYIDNLGIVGPDQVSTTGILANRYMKISNLFITDFVNGIICTQWSNEIINVDVRKLKGGGVGLELGTTGTISFNQSRVDYCSLQGQSAETDVGIKIHGGAPIEISNCNFGDNLYGVQVVGSGRVSIRSCYGDPQFGGAAAGAFVYVNSASAIVNVDNSYYNSNSTATTSYPFWVEAGRLSATNNWVLRSAADNYGAAFRIGAGNAKFHYGAGNKVDLGNETVYVSIDPTNRNNVTSYDTFSKVFVWDTAASDSFVFSPTHNGSAGKQFAMINVEMFNIETLTGTISASDGIEIGWFRAGSNDPNGFATVKVPDSKTQYVTTVLDTWVNQDSLEIDMSTDESFVITATTNTLTGGKVVIKLDFVRFDVFG
jgi:hypothetical protein